MRPVPATTLLLLANKAVAVILWLAGDIGAQQLSIAGGVVPSRLTAALDGVGGALPALASLITNQFLHAGWLHLGLNMIMLLAMGRLLEPVYGGGRLLFLYLAGGVVAALAEFVSDPGSLVPVVGASGSISAFIGAQALLINHVRAGPASSRLVLALKLALAWSLVQWLAGAVLVGQGINLAVAGHVGGFVAGLALAFPLLPSSVDGNAGA